MDAEEEGAVTSGTDEDEDESYRPSPKVITMPCVPFCFLLAPYSIYPRVLNPCLNCFTYFRKSVLGDRTKMKKMKHRHRKAIQAHPRFETKLYNLYPYH